MVAVVFVALLGCAKVWSADRKSAKVMSEQSIILAY
jgi:hypothetical protein